MCQKLFKMLLLHSSTLLTTSKYHVLNFMCSNQAIVQDIDLDGKDISGMERVGDDAVLGADGCNGGVGGPWKIWLGNPHGENECYDVEHYL